MTTKSASERLVSLDAFRGATIAAMILVNNSGDSANTWWPLLHQPWHGWTPTDLVFPFFLWIAGMSLVFSRRIGLRAALWRSAKLVLLGLLVNFATGGFALPLRWAGVLQRIGLCYLAAWAAKRWLGPRGQAVLAALLLVGYWTAMKHVVGPEGLVPNLEPETNLSAQVDRIVLDGHLYRWTKTWDPEGVLSTFPAVATALLGLLAGEWLRSGRRPRPKLVGFAAGGLAFFVLGVLWGEAAPAWLLFPVNKNLWSPSFVLLTAGLASALFGLTWWLVDVDGLRAGTGPFVTYGRNAIAVYVGSELLSGAWSTIAWASAGGEVLTLQERLHQAAFASWLPPALAAFAFAGANVVLWWAVARWMDRRGIYLKV
ncbi:MAG TPA: heparan-alpha-glucosaminide N-acetyltransferase domain-containing protein [Vicinamibacteria bacterium]